MRRNRRSAWAGTRTYSHQSGSVFAPGVTAVVAEAVDAAGNRASCSFAVEVVYETDTVKPKKPKSGGGCAAGGDDAGAVALLVASLALARKRRV